MAQNNHVRQQKSGQDLNPRLWCDQQGPLALHLPDVFNEWNECDFSHSYPVAQDLPWLASVRHCGAAGGDEHYTILECVLDGLDFVVQTLRRNKPSVYASNTLEHQSNLGCLLS